jgi:hypothetical protein
MDAPSREIGGAVLYLDFDGVLHPEHVYWRRRRGAHIGAEADGNKLFEHGPLLDSLLDPLSRHTHRSEHILRAAVAVRRCGAPAARGTSPEVHRCHLSHADG